MRRIERVRPPTEQRGAVLVVSLLFLLLLTIIGINSIQSTTMQERMAGNTRDVGTAFQAAEAAIRDAEEYLQGASIGSFSTPQSGRYNTTTNPAPSWSLKNAVGWTKVARNVAGLEIQPEYIIEQMPPVNSLTGSLEADVSMVPSRFYRITARGYGTTPESMVVLQTMFRR